MSSQQDELNQQLEDENSKVETIKELKKALRSLDAKLSRSLKAEERLNHDIVVQRNKQFEHSAVRVRALGEDRSWRRYWWMDVHLVRPSQRAQSSGLLLVEIPKGGDNGGSDWAYYDTLEQLDALLGFLNPLGCREARLGATITQHKEQIAKILSPFPINETPSPPSDEEMPTMVRRRSAAKRRAEELPEYLRYRNTLKSGKKCNK